MSHYGLLVDLPQVIIIIIIGFSSVHVLTRVVLLPQYNNVVGSKPSADPSPF